jgi:hypothetical protein
MDSSLEPGESGVLRPVVSVAADVIAEVRFSSSAMLRHPYLTCRPRVDETIGIVQLAWR